MENSSHSAAPAAAQSASPKRAAEAVVRPSLQEVYDQTLPFVLRKARRLGVGESDIDDVTQEVFVAVFRRLHDFEGRSSVRTWVLGILARLVQNYRRRQRRKGTEDARSRDSVDPEQIPDGRADPAEFASRLQAWRVLHTLLDELSDEKASVFVMAELEGMTLREIAELTNTNIGTIASRLRAARSDFAIALAKMRGLPPEPDEPGELTPRVLALLESARNVDDPSDADEERIFASISVLIENELARAPGPS